MRSFHLLRRIARPRESGWISGLFPQAPRPGAAHRQQRYALYVPRGVRCRAALLVMLHGCSQDARSFAAGTRMNELAERRRFIVLYPEQSRQANPLACWNWFHRDPGRKGGEAARIAALIRSVCLHYPIDRSRVYVAGMSAGGAMTAILALTHGALFAACAVASGVMYGAADSAAGAVQQHARGLAALARGARRRGGRGTVARARLRAGPGHSRRRRPRRAPPQCRSDQRPVLAVRRTHQ